MAVVVGANVYVHMPKTGGDFVSSYLRREHGGRDILGPGHMAANEILNLEGRRLFGTIRDPWSWYASWWMHAKEVPLRKEWLTCYGAGSDSFRDVLRGALARDKETTPVNVGVIWAGVETRSARASYLSSGVGLYSWVYQHIYGDLVKTLIDTPQLYDGLHAVLGTKVDQDRWPPRNTRMTRPGSAVEDIRTLYTDDMISTIWRADRALIKKLGYTEPFGESFAPVIQLP